jgi:small subunit ribosomal protein S27e
VDPKLLLAIPLIPLLCSHFQKPFIMPYDLLHPPAEVEQNTHKLKRLVQTPNSFFMDIKCPGCFQITTVFSHAQTVVMCAGCNIHLCEPTGGKARLTEGCSYRRKVD